MSATYQMPVAVSLAVTSDRVEFLKGLKDSDLTGPGIADLLRDLLNDRASLRQNVIQAVDSLDEIRNQIEASIGRFSHLLDILDGRDGPEWMRP